MISARPFALTWLCIGSQSLWSPAQSTLSPQLAMRACRTVSTIALQLAMGAWKAK